MTWISASSASASCRVETGSKPGIRLRRDRGVASSQYSNWAFTSQLEVGNGLAHLRLDPLALRVGEPGRLHPAGDAEGEADAVPELGNLDRERRPAEPPVELPGELLVDDLPCGRDRDEPRELEHHPGGGLAKLVAGVLGQLGVGYRRQRDDQAPGVDLGLQLAQDGGVLRLVRLAVSARPSAYQWLMSM